MKKIRISFDDGDPWHLSIVPLIVAVIGIAGFFTGAARFVLDGLNWGTAIALTLGAIAFGAGGVGMVREHLSQAAVLEESRARAEREAGAG